MPTINAAIGYFLKEQRVRLNAPKTIRDYSEKLGLWMGYFGDMYAPIESVTTDNMRDYIVSRSERGLARETIRSYITALKVFWSWCADEYNIPDVMQRIKKPAKKKQAPKAISTANFIAIFEAAKGYQAIDWRNRALLALLADTGARRGEIVSLTVDAIDTVRRIATVSGKTGERQIYWTHYTNKILFWWLSVRPPCKTDALFVSALLLEFRLWEQRLIVVQVVVGSSPIIHPRFRG